MKIVLNYSSILLVSAFLITAVIFTYTILNFKINTDLSDMVSDRLPFRKIEEDFSNAFPALSGNIVVVIDAETPEAALKSRDRLAAQLMKEKNIFKSVYVPGGGIFFEKNKLLFMSVDELEQLGDTLAEAQPFLALLSRDLNLGGLFSALDTLVRRSDEDWSDNTKIALLFERIHYALEHAVEKKPWHVSWQEIVTDEQVNKDQLRQFIIVKPFLDFSDLYPGQEAMTTIRRTADHLKLTSRHGVTVRITGGVAIRQDDLKSVENGIGIAGIVSLILVGVVLYTALRSCRMVVAGLVTLITGLIWTLGFAIVFLGSLNLISITFAVLFIGLGIDYSIQFCLRYGEFLEAGLDRSAALTGAAHGVCNALLLCTLTTAFGFYAFVPTTYSGASELGIISGTGMFINFFTNLTVLPALLSTIPVSTKRSRPLSIPKIVGVLPEKFPKTILAVGFLMLVASVPLLSKVSFDFNPLNLSPQAAESVATAKDLFTSERAAPWTISVLVDSERRVQQLAAALRDLPEVETTLSIHDFVPGMQIEKRDLISDIALFFPSLRNESSFPSSGHEQTVRASKRFEQALDEHFRSSAGSFGAAASKARRLYQTIKRFNSLSVNPEKVKPVIAALEEGLVVNLAVFLHSIEESLQPDVFDESALPRGLKKRFVSQDGRYRIEVFAREDITEIDALKRFVAAVRTIAPDATDAPVTILESGNAIISAFRRATIFALIIITALLLAALKNRLDAILILTPLVAAIVLTASTTVLLKIPFNFANIIVIPLLLGIGVDYGIHMIYRFRMELSSQADVLQTSTARAVLFSALTTLVSFGSLSFLSHRGTASMGMLLTLCICFILLCTLIFLPAFLNYSISRPAHAGPGKRKD